MAPLKVDEPAKTVVGLPSTSAEPALAEAPLMGTPVSSSRILADYRVNLTVHYDEHDECVAAGGVYDIRNEVLFAPPRVDLRPLEKWLPFALEDTGHTRTSGGMFLMHRPGVIAAAGSTKVLPVPWL